MLVVGHCERSMLVVVVVVVTASLHSAVALQYPSSHRLPLKHCASVVQVIEHGASDW